MYCGDETGGIVVDVGCQNARFGWAGEDTPKGVFSSVVSVSAAPGDVLTADGIGASAGAAAGAVAPGRSGARVIRVGPGAKVPRPHYDMRLPFDFGMVEDWDVLEKIWEYGMHTLSADAAAHPVLVAEPQFSTPQQREKQAELLFESFKVPAMYSAKAPVLGAFSMGRSTAVVVDIGASSTRVTPVYDGYVLTKGMHMSEIGGAFLTEALLTAVVRGGYLTGTEIPPRYAYKKVSRKGKSTSSSSSSAAAGGAGAGAGAGRADDAEMAAAGSSSSSSSSAAGGAGAGAGAGAGSSTSSSSYGLPLSSIPGLPPPAPPRFVRAAGAFDVYSHDFPGVTPNFRSSAELDVIDDMKRAVCTVHDTGYAEGSVPAPDPVSYELPDGQTVKVAGLRMAIPELLFSGDHMDAYRHLIGMRSTSAWLLHYNSGVNVRIQSEPGVMSSTPIPLPKAVHSALLMSPPEIRRDLSNNVLLTGGGANLHNIQERLKWELIAAVPAAFKPRVVAPSPVEREFATWIGGSVLSSLGTFQQMWISKLEYEEEGASVVERKCGS